MFFKKNRRPTYFLTGLSKERDYFVENISMLIEGGVPILDAVDNVRRGVKSRRMKKILYFFREDIESGSTVGEALEKTGLFAAHTISLIKLGEESGRLNENLKIAVEEQEKARSFRAKFYSAIMYPVFVFTLTIFLAIGIVWFILPRLSATFAQMNVELPSITRGLIKVGEFMTNYGAYFVPSLVIFLILFLFILFTFKKTKFLGQYILLNSPGVGRLLKEIEIARFGYLLGILLEAGIPIKKALESLFNATEMAPYKKFYKHLRDSIEDGNSIKKSMGSYKKTDKLLPPPVQQLMFA